MNINQAILSFKIPGVKPRDAEKLRGCFAGFFSEESLFHNHSGDGTINRYPLIQYKVQDGKAMVVGLGEGADLVAQSSYSIDEINIGGCVYPADNTKLDYGQTEIGINSGMIRYEFSSPYIALNQQNEAIYKRSTPLEKQILLEKIITGNLMSFSKGVGYHVDEPIAVRVALKETAVKLKNIDMIAFTGELCANYKLPLYVGLGKSAAKGFGVVR